MKTENRRLPIAGIVLWCIVGVAVLLIVVLAIAKRPEEQVDEVPMKSVPVRVMSLVARSIADTVVLTGRLEPASDVVVSSEKAGPVMELKVDKGDSVVEGDILLRIDSRSWQNLADAAAIERREAEKDDTRWSALAKNGAVSVKAVEDVRTRRDRAEIAYRDAMLSVEKCDVRAPVAGRVEDRWADLGEYVNEGAPVMRLVDTRKVKLVVDIPERDVVRVAPGAEVTFTVTVLGEQRFRGEIIFVSEAASTANNAYRAEILSDNGDGALRAGMIAEATFVRGEHEGVVVVPLAAIIPKNGEHAAFVVVDGRAERRVVQIMQMRGHEALIKVGLEAGESLVVEGHRSLADGAVVNVVTEEIK